MAMDYGEAYKSSLPTLIEEGEVVDFQVLDIEVTETGPNSKTPGRPMLLWSLEVINHAEYSGRRFRENTVLPWEQDGVIIDSGVFRLVQIFKAIGEKWKSKTLDTSDYIGKVGTLMVGVQDYFGSDEDRAGSKVNYVKKFLKA